MYVVLCDDAGHYGGVYYPLIIQGLILFHRGHSLVGLH
jgi:hypothetical protein